MDDLLHLVNSDRADELWLHVGSPPVIVLEGQRHFVDGPPLTTEETENLLQSIATNRQRRELREQGAVKFIYRFRQIKDFVVCARMQGDEVALDIQ